MGKRYRLIINHEWIASSDDLDELNQMAASISISCAEREDDYYGNYPDIYIYDTVEKCEA